MSMSAGISLHRNHGVAAGRPLFSGGKEKAEKTRDNTGSVGQTAQPAERAADDQPGAFRRAGRGMKKLTRKMTSWREFRAGVRQGRKEVSRHWGHDFRQKSKPKKALQVAQEAVGGVVLVAFSWVPGPNPGWFLSPTSWSFGRGFMQARAATVPDGQSDRDLEALLDEAR